MRTPSWACQPAPRLEGQGSLQGCACPGAENWGVNPREPPSEQSGAQPPHLQEGRKNLGSRSPPGRAGMHGIPSPLHTHARSNLINKSKNEVLHVAAKHY